MNPLGMEQEKIYRYPGLKPFSLTERNIFFGRKEDTRRLHQQIQVENQVVLYARSGLGKSSLLNAGVIPSLMDVGNFAAIRVRFGAYNQQNSASLVEQVYEHIAEQHPVPEFLTKVGTATDSLWHAAKRTEVASPEIDTFVLVFDQFEEVFTYPKAEIDRFKKELADLVHNVIPRTFRTHMEAEMAANKQFLSDEEIRQIYDPLNIKAVYAIRSDKLSLMDQLKDVMPEILSRTYELSALNRGQSEDAILNPAYQKGDHFASPRFDFKDEAIDAILDFLTKSGDSEVESFQLQVICQYAESLVIDQEKKSISREDLGEISDIFKNYYENLISQLPTDYERGQARRFIEEGLILEEDEIRLSLHEGQIQRDFQMPADLLQKLVNTRLVRREPSPRGGFIYELSHDTLIAPILKSRNRRLQDDREALQALDAQKARRRLIGAVVTLIVMTIAGFGALFFGMWAWNQKVAADVLKDRAVEDKKVIQAQKQQADSLLLVINSMLIDQEELLIQVQNDSTSDAMVASTTPSNNPNNPTKPRSKPRAEAVADNLKQNQALQEEVGRVLNVKTQNKRQEYVEFLFNSTETVRKQSQNALLRNWVKDPSLAGELAEYGLKHLDNDNGIWQSLYLLEQLDDKALKPHKEIIIQYLDKLKDKEYGAKTQKQMANIRSKLE